MEVVEVAPTKKKVAAWMLCAAAGGSPEGYSQTTVGREVVRPCYTMLEAIIYLAFQSIHRSSLQFNVSGLGPVIALAELHDAGSTRTTRGTHMIV